MKEERDKDLPNIIIGALKERDDVRYEEKTRFSIYKTLIKTVYRIKETSTGWISRKKIQPVVKIREHDGKYVIELFKEGEGLKIETDYLDSYPYSIDPITGLPRLGYF